MVESEVFLLPDQLPEAVQLVAVVLLQSNVVEPSITTLFGFADRVTVGSGGAPTETFTVSLSSPLIPVQVSKKVLSAVSELIISEPVVLLLPDQSPEAIQLSTSLVDQSTVMLPL